MIAILSDIHSNLEAFLAVLEDMKKFSIKEIYVLGDIVGYGPNPNECVELVKEIKALAIKGNHEQALLQRDFLLNFNPVAARIITWTKDKLNKKNTQFLSSLPLFYRKDDIVFSHGSLLSTDKYIMESLDIMEEVEELRNLKIKVEFFGHTHMKVIFVEDEKPISPSLEWIKLNPQLIHLINPGSIGQPRDRDPASSYVLYDLKNNQVLYRRIEYDVEQTIEKMKKEGFPPFTYNRLRLGM